jgi:hypothetical protein
MKSTIVLLGIALYSNVAFSRPPCNVGGGWQSCGAGSDRSYCGRTGSTTIYKCADSTGHWEGTTKSACCGAAIRPPNPVSIPKKK